MKIIISPAKSLDFETVAPTSLHTQPRFLKQSEKLNRRLRELTKKELADLMHISNDLATLNYERNQQWNPPFDLDNTKQAVYAFTGDVYRGLDATTLSEKSIPVMQDKLRILSGLYGLLKPLDLIQPYRLEMGTKLEIGTVANLYQFWGDQLVNELNNDMTKEEVLVDLASKEYSKVLPLKKIKPKVITPVFKELKGDTYKTIAIYAKKARGLMARFIIENNIDDVEDLKRFNLDNYAFSQELSRAKQWVFTR